MSDASPEVRLANDIARQFAHLDPRSAAARIAAHIEKYWELRMHADLRARVDQGDPDLDPLVVAATELLPPMS